jgi:hypothetical protein
MALLYGSLKLVDCTRDLVGILVITMAKFYDVRSSMSIAMGVELAAACDRRCWFHDNEGQVSAS